ncbi:hypothetical protein JXC34_00965 [Candidatus Woesearchaeota archaeon]|nr:hypothetical protein [Candidatus Woesearchaeota archaeon]
MSSLDFIVGLLPKKIDLTEEIGGEYVLSYDISPGANINTLSIIACGEGREISGLYLTLLKQETSVIEGDVRYAYLFMDENQTGTFNEVGFFYLIARRFVGSLKACLNETGIKRIYFSPRDSSGFHDLANDLGFEETGYRSDNGGMVYIELAYPGLDS